MTKTGIAIMAKAPIPGLAKTRLIPALGAHGAAALQAQLIERTAEIAATASLGPVTIWGAPDLRHPLFGELAQRLHIAIAHQPEGDLGQRMLAACCANDGPTLVIGTDCPGLTAPILRDAAEALREVDVVAIPAKDGGYVLIGTHRPQSALFDGMTWSVPSVMRETRKRAASVHLNLRELPPLWDVDEPADLVRLRADATLSIFA